MFQELPSSRPDTPLLDTVNAPEMLRGFNSEQLLTLSQELREYLLYCVNCSGGHFGAGLGVIELTIALHYVFQTPDDRLVWDVGHQAYPHKILTGRRERMTSIRQQAGLAAFPRREESPYDTFGVGHSSTSISAALGMAIAGKMAGSPRKTVAVIGDGALTAGMAFEALNHAGNENADLLVVLNDNDMSISNNVGALSKYLARILSSKTYTSMREGGKQVLSNIPHATELARKTEEHMKGMVLPGTLFEELGFNYIGPIDGHDLPMLVRTLANIRQLSGPQFLHVVTKKGKGFEPAEKNPIKYHALSASAPAGKKSATKTSPPPVKKALSFSNIFGQWACDMANKDDRLVAITPAMREGSDLVAFSEKFPERYHDVAIAEQHAVTLAAGLACENVKPVVAIYSTFLQRAYDQLIHDVAIQNLDVLFAIDRAGLVGADGPTHSGNYDLSFLRCIPNLLIMAPSDEREAAWMLSTGYYHSGPAAVRYPRGSGTGISTKNALSCLEIGKANIKRAGHSIAILSFGTILSVALDAAEILNATVVDMRFIKPLDEQIILELASSHELLVTLEENTVKGGAGSGVNELLAEHAVVMPMLNLGLPDQYIEHASQKEQLEMCKLDVEHVTEAIKKRISLINEWKGRHLQKIKG